MAPKTGAGQKPAPDLTEIRRHGRGGQEAVTAIRPRSFCAPPRL